VPDCSTEGPVTFTPPASRQPNDFNLVLSTTTPGDYICYTLDGVTAPECSVSPTFCAAGHVYNGGAPFASTAPCETRPAT
jgi:hypothetical protein